jgi:hypothetical protein
MIRNKVVQFSAKAVFNSLDNNRSGRISAKEMVGAMREMEVHVSDTQAQELVSEINSLSGGPPSSSHVGFLAFNQVFDRSFDKGTIGDSSHLAGERGVPPPGVHAASDERPTTPASMYTRVWKGQQAMASLSAEQAPSPIYVRAQSARVQGEASRVAKRFSDERDSIERMAATTRPASATAATTVELAKK